MKRAIKYLTFWQDTYMYPTSFGKTFRVVIDPSNYSVKFAQGYSANRWCFSKIVHSSVFLVIVPCFGLGLFGVFCVWGGVEHVQSRWIDFRILCSKK